MNNKEADEKTALLSEIGIVAINLDLNNMNNKAAGEKTALFSEIGTETNN